MIGSYLQEVIPCLSCAFPVCDCSHGSSCIMDKEITQSEHHRG
uniref:Uncharacterized protein n=1 Tax=Anguilla anguilla TaxID=7936 RepID=A0A0E9RL41_ANGAN